MPPAVLVAAAEVLAVAVLAVLAVLAVVVVVVAVLAVLVVAVLAVVVVAGDGTLALPSLLLTAPYTSSSGRRER